jgi:hypothetical protein
MPKSKDKMTHKCHECGIDYPVDDLITIPTKHTKGKPTEVCEICYEKHYGGEDSGNSGIQ